MSVKGAREIITSIYTQYQRVHSASVFISLIVFLLVSILFLISVGGNVEAQETTPGNYQQPEDGLRQVARHAFLADQHPAETAASLAATPCVAGFAGNYPCRDVDLLAHMPLSTFNSGKANDIWGWTDPLDGTEYALLGLDDGTAFVDISDSENPLYLGKLPSHTGKSSSWRDVKVYLNHAFVVSDGNSGHGMQVFDLTRLRDVTNPPVTFSEDGHYDGVSSAHNVAINEASGYAYIVGANAGSQSGCSGGLHMVDISTPAAPTFAGCFSDDGYTHDAQCLIYQGMDQEYNGREICFNANEDTVTIVDVTDKTNPQQLSRTGYSGSRYTHQIWLTEDHSRLFVNDEYDERTYGHNTRTYIWDISDLDNPQNSDYYTSSSTAIDHNHFVMGNLLYQANYRAGLRILDISDAVNGNLVELGYFDIYPANDNANFNGAWGNYPFFASGVVIVSGIEQGLFILRSNVVAQSRQEIGLEPGWNLISSNIDPQSPNLAELLAPIEDEIVLLKNGEGDIYWPEFGIDQIENWEKLDGYSIYALSAQTLTMTGRQMDAGVEAAQLNQGWNLIGYWRQTTMEITEALASVKSQLVLVKNEDGQVYWPELDINGFSTLHPGEGYQLLLNSPATLQYPD